MCVQSHNPNVCDTECMLTLPETQAMRLTPKLMRSTPKLKNISINNNMLLFLWNMGISIHLAHTTGVLAGGIHVSVPPDVVDQKA